mmetsp:Transcript_109059/g.307418  ORF Transcript_109059/g.307418 Transcript_109059/m.307418 type:complete len:269 (+) Transcript_109059:962-1768(+)
MHRPESVLWPRAKSNQRHRLVLQRQATAPPHSAFRTKAMADKRACRRSPTESEPGASALVRRRHENEPWHPGRLPCSPESQERAAVGTRQWASLPSCQRSPAESVPEARGKACQPPDCERQRLASLPLGFALRSQAARQTVASQRLLTGGALPRSPAHATATLLTLALRQLSHTESALSGFAQCAQAKSCEPETRKRLHSDCVRPGLHLPARRALGHGHQDALVHARTRETPPREESPPPWVPEASRLNNGTPIAMAKAAHRSPLLAW